MAAFDGDANCRPFLLSPPLCLLCIHTLAVPPQPFRRFLLISDAAAAVRRDANNSGYAVTTARDVTAATGTGRRRGSILVAAAIYLTNVGMT